jgi:hypothetical protein
MDNAAAIRACRAGDLDALRHLVDRYQCRALAHALRAMRREAERACDDRALETGVSPIDYADLLVSAAARTGSAGFSLPMAATTDLEDRLTAILRSDIRRQRCSTGRVILLALMTVAGGVRRRIGLSRRTHRC